MATDKTIVAIDPGFNGAIAVVHEKGWAKVWDMPVIEYETGSGKAKKKRKKYDLLAIRDILSGGFLAIRPIVLLEGVHTMKGEGSVSAFNFGRGVGSLEGLIVGVFGYEPTIVFPQTWKKNYPGLTNEDMKALKEQEKKLAADIKAIKGKDKAKKKSMEKELEKLQRQFKSQAKGNARQVAAKLRPELADQFELVKHDGRAEALLIALFGKDKGDELVQEAEGK